MGIEKKVEKIINKKGIFRKKKHLDISKETLKLHLLWASKREEIRKELKKNSNMLVFLKEFKKVIENYKTYIEKYRVELKEDKVEIDSILKYLVIDLKYCKSEILVLEEVKLKFKNPKNTKYSKVED